MSTDEKVTVRRLSDKPASAVFDNGRRGEPLIGCDCVQCFGYCLVDPEIAMRERATREEIDTPLADMVN